MKKEIVTFDDGHVLELPDADYCSLKKDNVPIARIRWDRIRRYLGGGPFHPELIRDAILALR